MDASAEAARLDVLGRSSAILEASVFIKTKGGSMNIGENIAIARKNLKLTQADLADKMNVSYQAVSSWERDENLPDTINLIALASVLKVTIDWLVYNGI